MPYKYSKEIYRGALNLLDGGYPQKNLLENCIFLQLPLEIGNLIIQNPSIILIK